MQTFTIFLFCSGLSGILSGIKTVIGFFQRQNTEHRLNAEPSQVQSVIQRAAKAWEKPGFFESISLGRFLLDGAALLSGMHIIAGIFSGIRHSTVALITLGICFAISHWIFPVLAQAFSPKLGNWALRAYRLYSFFFMGKLGEVLFQTHDLALRKLGIDPKLSFLGESNLQKYSPSADEDSPDRSGLEDDEKEMIRSIFDLRETQVKEIMTPRVDMISLEIATPYGEVMPLIQNEKFSRIPVYAESIDRIQGILHAMDMMGLREEEKDAGFHLADILREAYFVPRTKKIGELLREFRMKHIHMAIVVDEYGGTAGLITLEDILEEIVGEIHDEDETETVKIKKVEDGVYIINPIISLSDLNEELSLSLKPEDPDIQIDTLGGFILFIHGKVPETDDEIRFKDFTFQILEMDGKKMEKIKMALPVSGGFKKTAE